MSQAIVHVLHAFTIVVSLFQDFEFSNNF